MSVRFLSVTSNVINHARSTTVCKFNGTCVKYLSSIQSVKQTSQAEVLPQQTYKLVYKLSVIRAAGVVGKSKLYQTWLTALAIPASFAVEYTGIIGHEAYLPMTVVVVGLAANMAIYSVGMICNRLIGFIYITLDNSKVKISHLDFWGKRVDNIYETNDIVPISELSDKLSSMYINIKRYSSKQDFLKLSLKYGAIEDVDLFRKIFGYMH